MTGLSQVWLAIPDLTTGEPLPWWAYALVSLGVLIGGGVVRLELLHYRAVQTGTLIPRITMDLVVAAKDAEIAHLQGEVDRWIGVYHIADSAYKELAQSIDENTDAMRAVVDRATGPARINSNSEATSARRRERA